MNNSVRAVFERGKSALKKAGTENAEAEALEMCLKCADMGRTDFLLYPEKEMSNAATDNFDRMVSERISGRPLQYILGEWSFFGREFYVGEGVLIPRPETEQLADICIDRIKKYGYKTVYDLCAGSGCIGITVSAECRETQTYLFELFDGAFGFLQKNAERYNNGRIHTVCHDVLCGAPEKLPAPDVIISNPPYIPSDELETLQSEVKREPATALDGGTSGLVFYEAIAEKWVPILKSGGLLAVECGEGQTGAIEKLLTKYGKTTAVYDMYGTKRFVTLEKKLKEPKNDNHTF